MSWTTENTLAVIKEVTATVIAAAIVVGFVVSLHATWGLLEKPQLAAAKDLLQILTGLVGVVAGYYFGRVPAERTADAAQKEAKASRDVAATAQRGETETRRNAAVQVRRALDQLGPRGPLGGGQPGSPTAADVLNDLLATLESA